jgi:hypothetical protein
MTSREDIISFEFFRFPEILFIIADAKKIELVFEGFALDLLLLRKIC